METSPWKVLSSQVGVGILTEGWSLDVVDPFHYGARTHLVEVTFDSPFLAPPVVHLGLTGFDVDQRDSARLTLKAENITATGFTASIGTWADSRIFSAEFQWLAIGA